MKKLIHTVFICLLSFQSFSQLPFYEDVFYGGVTGDGYNPYSLATTGTLDLYIEPGSTIRKAYLFVSVITVDSVLDNTLIFNGAIIDLSADEAINNLYIVDPAGPQLYTIRTLAIDVTSLISPAINSYSLTSPNNQSPLAQQGVFADFYLYVTYNNPSLSKVNAVAMINNQDALPSVTYSFANQNIVDLTSDIGFTFNAEAMCDTAASIADGSYVYADGSLLGLVGGDESNLEPGCTGVRGAFYYQNATLFGLDNDVANNTMDGIDALANIAPYIVDANNFGIRFDHQNIGGIKDKTNPINQLFLTYSTPCDTFSVSVPNDTLICQNEQIQLNVTGGQTYEWAPSVGLSCSDCPNPIFTGDSTMYYTVRIWNNDSCSVVRPLFIKVVPPPTFGALNTSASDCGTNNGELVLIPSDAFPEPFSYSVDGGIFQSNPQFTNLSAGNHTVSLIDGHGCTSDSMATILQQNTTVASVSVNPLGGLIPLNIDVENNSTNATNYEWSINNSYQGTSLTNFTCDTIGTYTIQLIAWQYDPSCADTAYASIIASQEVIIPTAFTPDNDLVNDYWQILNLDDQYPHNTVQIFNRWGNQIFLSEEGKYNQNPWNGTYQGEPLPVGSYYFIIQLKDPTTEDITGNISIIRK